MSPARQTREVIEVSAGTIEKEQGKRGKNREYIPTEAPHSPETELHSLKKESRATLRKMWSSDGEGRIGPPPVKPTGKWVTHAVLQETTGKIYSGMGGGKKYTYVQST